MDTSQLFFCGASRGPRLAPVVLVEATQTGCVGISMETGRDRRSELSSSSTTNPSVLLKPSSETSSSNMTPCLHMNMLPQTASGSDPKRGKKETQLSICLLTLPWPFRGPPIISAFKRFLTHLCGSLWKLKLVGAGPRNSWSSGNFGEFRLSRLQALKAHIWEDCSFFHSQQKN
ncbi:hypothetical protein AMECASPLE_027124 [Ameca splendens]|uniref:Uncharacterized protein n=1 Tax=Ameca splendens TaxID=208324 RepID=A0ABV0Y521_9TELE